MSDEKATAALAVVTTMVDALNADYQGHWYTTHDVLHLMRTLGAAGFIIVPAADVHELTANKQAAQEQLAECVRALELEKAANTTLQKVIDALSAAQTADVPTPEERAVLEECATEGGIKDWADRVWEKERARREARRAAKEAKGG